MRKYVTWAVFRKRRADGQVVQAVQHCCLQGDVHCRNVGLYNSDLQVLTCIVGMSGCTTPICRLFNIARSISGNIADCLSITAATYSNVNGNINT